MPKFNKTVDELETRFEKWLYVLRNLNKLDRIPDKLRERIFDKLFETAEIAKFTPEQIRSYEDSLKYYRDLKNSLDTAKEEGWLKGKTEGKIEGKMDGKLEVARNLIKNGVAIEIIIKATGLTEDEINRLA
jgi:predicted transposase/invertase (TIGR01784 family)